MQEVAVAAGVNRRLGGHLGLAEALAAEALLDHVNHAGHGDIEGFDVARALARDGPPPHIVLTSSREATAYGPRLVGALVLGFIPKDELSGAAIRAMTSS